MPGGNGTGPAGMGPMTGRGAGFCAGYGTPGYMNPIPGQGAGMGFGRGFGGRGGGRGMGRGFRGGQGLAGYGAVPYAAPAYPYGAPYGAGPTSEQEADMLKGQAEYFEDAMQGIKKRIAELEAKTDGKK